MCVFFFCVSLGCIFPGSLSLLGRGTGASKSGIHNLWAAGPCQGAAATQHVSTTESAHPPATWVLSSSLLSFQQKICLRSKHDFRTHLLAAIKIFPLLCPEILAMFHHLCNHIYSSTGQGWNPTQKGKIQSHTLPSVVWCLHLWLVLCNLFHSMFYEYSGKQSSSYNPITICFKIITKKVFCLKLMLLNEKGLIIFVLFESFLEAWEHKIQ